MSAPEIKNDGDCFVAAFGIAESMDQLGAPVSSLLCHGTPVFRGPGADGRTRFWHAWVEIKMDDGWKVADYSNGRRVLMDRADYYRAGKIVTNRHVWRYTITSAWAELHRNDGRAGPWVPGWEEMAR